MRYIGWEDRVFFITPPHIFRGFISVCGGWMLLCKEFIMAEQSPRQCIMTGRINAIIYLKNSKDKHSVSTQVWSITAVAMCAHKHCTNPKWSITAWLISYQIFNAQSTVKIVLYIYIYYNAEAQVVRARRNTALLPLHQSSMVVSDALVWGLGLMSSTGTSCAGPHWLPTAACTWFKHNPSSLCLCLCVCIHVVCTEFWQYVSVENV